MHASRREPLAFRTVALVFGAMCLSLVAYANALGNPFVYDDHLEILENGSIEDLSNPAALVRASLTRPIVNISYAVDFAIWGGRHAFGFHLTNLVFHCLNVGLLFLLVWHFTRDVEDAEARPRAASAAPLAAFAAASLFAVHPAMTEAVGYVSSRSEVLAATFFMGSLYCLRHRLARGPFGWLAGGLILFGLLLGTRETAVALPFVLLAYDRLLLRNGFARAMRFTRVHAPLIVFVVMACVVRVWLYVTVEHGDAESLQWQNSLIAIQVLARYLVLLVLPIGQSLVHGMHPISGPGDTRLLTAIAVGGVLVVTAWRARRKWPLVSLGLIWFVIALLPSSALIVLTERGQPMAEHRVYLASCGFFLAVAAVVGRMAAPWLAAGRRVPVPIAAALSLMLAVLLSLTIARNRVWASPVALWTDAVQKAPGTFHATFGLASALRLAGDDTSAEPAFQQAIALQPALAEGYLGLSALFVDQNRIGDASETLRLAIQRVPADFRPRLALAALVQQTNAAEALQLCQSALTLRPALPEAEACVRRNQARLVHR
jgi:hypothetical protein